MGDKIDLLNGVLYMRNEDGSLKKVMSAIDMPSLLTSDDEDVEPVLSFYSDKSCSFTMTLNQSRRDSLKMMRALLRGTNNWRKMHGLPLMRYR